MLVIVVLGNDINTAKTALTVGPVQCHLETTNFFSRRVLPDGFKRGHNERTKET